MKTNGSLDRVLNSDMDSRRMCFEQGAAGKAIPYGIYDMGRNEAWVGQCRG